jgi:Domain of unknown function (DUF932)
METNNPFRFIGKKTLNLDEVKTVAPAAFSSSKAPQRSEKYSFVSTEELLKAFENLGWKPFSAKQVGNSEFSRHTIRLENPSLGFIDTKTDKIKPQIILDNSHNGTSTAKLHMGLFRLVCSNGLVVSMPNMSTHLKFRHMGVDFNELKNLVETIANHYNEIGQTIVNMQKVGLTEEQKEDFAIRAMAAREPHRFFDEHDNLDKSIVTKMINPSEVVKAVREEDENDDLWTVFNVIQEKMVNGNFERKLLSGRKATARGITNTVRHIEYNKILWDIAASYMENKEVENHSLVGIEVGKSYGFSKIKNKNLVIPTNITITKKTEDGYWGKTEGSGIEILLTEERLKRVVLN